MLSFTVIVKEVVKRKCRRVIFLQLKHSCCLSNMSLILTPGQGLTNMESAEIITTTFIQRLTWYSRHRYNFCQYYYGQTAFDENPKMLNVTIVFHQPGFYLIMHLFLSTVITNIFLNLISVIHSTGKLWRYLIVNVIIKTAMHVFCCFIVVRSIP